MLYSRVCIQLIRTLSSNMRKCETPPCSAGRYFTRVGTFFTRAPAHTIRTATSMSKSMRSAFTRTAFASASGYTRNPHIGSSITRPPVSRFVHHCVIRRPTSRPFGALSS
jgi:hypothetical protein